MPKLKHIFQLPFILCLFWSVAQGATPKQPDCPFDVQAILNAPTCPGGEDGSIELSDTTGVILDYEWLNIGPLPVGTRPDSLGNLEAGHYILQVSHPSGCVDTLYFDLLPPAPLEFSITIDSTSCHNSADGVVIVIPAEDAPGLLYNIDYNIKPQASSTFKGVSSGEHLISISTPEGCEYERWIEVGAPPPIELSLDRRDVTCPNENDGEVAALASGGTGQFRYSLNGTDYVDNRRFPNLPPGPYTYFIRDDNGCTRSEPFIIEAAFTPNTTIISDSVSCPGLNDGQLIIIIEALDVLPITFEYSLDGMHYQADSIFSGLEAGIYDIFIRNSDGCVYAQQAIVGQNKWPMVQINIDHVTCSGANDGRLIIIIEALDILDNFTYSIDGLNFGSDTIFQNLAAGVYTIYLQNGNACITEIVVEIEEPEAIEIATQTEDLSCAGDQDGWIKINPIGGRPPFEYALNGQNFQVSPEFYDLAAGTYAVLIVDSAHCMFNKAINISEPPALEIQLSPQSEACSQANGSISSSVSGGTPPYDYRWDNGSDASLLSNLSADWYRLQITDAQQCMQQDSVVLENAPAPEIVQKTMEAVTCFGGQDASAEVEVYSESGPLQMLWSNGANGTKIEEVAAGIYILTVEDVNQCQSIHTIKIPEPKALVLDLDLDYLAQGASAQLNASGGVGDYTFAWSNASSGAYQEQLADGDYSITLSDANDCELIHSFSIKNPKGQPGHSWRLFPNPTAELLYVDLPLATTAVEVRVINKLGQVVWQNSIVTTSSPLELDFTVLPAAIYSIQIRSGDQQWNGSFIKQD